MKLKINTIATLLGVFFIMISCQNTSVSTTFVANEAELVAAIKNSSPGAIIVMKNGVWKDVQVKFIANGGEESPITIQAETDGKVFIEGVSNLKFGGEYLVVKGLYFRNGYTPSNAVIDFKINKKKVANNCRITNIVIEDFNQLTRDKKDHWVEFWGRNNQMDHCYLAGKVNEGPTVRVEIKGNRNSKNYHNIINNHFGPRPRKGGAKGETIQLGDSFSSMSPGNTTVAGNLFEECNGEVEIISSKTNFNVFRNNVFYKSEGSLVTRHGNYCVIDGNYFIGNGKNENYGGIRIINTGHWVTNNLFYNLKGKNFRSPLAVMNGIPKSPLNRYNQVTDVVVAYNTYIDSSSPWQFGVGTNISQKEVLPSSEIRSARPLRMEVANNVIYNSVGDANPIVEHDKADGVIFRSNIINNQGVDFKQRKGLIAKDFKLTRIGENLLAPVDGFKDVEPYLGFDFETITKDLFGNSRANSNQIGAIIDFKTNISNLLDKTKYGATWFSRKDEGNTSNTISVSNQNDLNAKVNQAKNGDVLDLQDGIYKLSSSVVINKSITIQAKGKVEIQFSGEKNTPAFELHPYGKLTLKNVSLKGTNTQYAFASLKENMFNHFGLTVVDSEISNFKYALKAYKQTYAEEITFENTSISNCENGIELSEEINDKGDYNTEYLTIKNCQFTNVKSNVIDYYRGGYDESTIGGNLMLSNSTFTNCGSEEKNGVLINTRGIVNVSIDNNTFRNNNVKLVALLWGAKNNTHSGNEISNSGKIRVEENLKLKLMY